MKKHFKNTMIMIILSFCLVYKNLNYTLRPKGKGKQITFFFLTKPKTTVEDVFQTRLQ